MRHRERKRREAYPPSIAPLRRLLPRFVGVAAVLGMVERLTGYAGSMNDGDADPFLRGILLMQPPWLILGALATVPVWLSARFPLDAVRWRRSLPVHSGVAFAFAFGYVHLWLLAAFHHLALHDPTPVMDQTLWLSKSYLIQDVFILLARRVAPAGARVGVLDDRERRRRRDSPTLA